MTALAYVDASAVVKLILREPESASFHRWYVEAERLATSRVGIVEIERAARRQSHLESRRMQVLSELDIIELDAAIGKLASGVGPAGIRTLDAIHLASAMRLQPDLDAFVTCDDRLAAAARAIGLLVIQPA
jgi:predicted nucleic acid-binding protein